MRILFLVSSLHGGGAERVAATLASAWAARGDEVFLVCTFSGRGRCDQVLDERVHLSWLADHLHGPSWLRPLEKIRALRRLARELKPDRVLSFLTNVNVTTLLATRGLGLPVVVSERTDPRARRGLERTFQILRRWTYPWAHAVVVQTERGVDHLRQVAPRVKRIQAIPNPLPPALPEARKAPADPMPGQRLQLVALGRFVALKQFDWLIRMFASVAPQCPQWDLVIWGEGPERAACRQLVQALGMGDRVRLPGFHEHPWDGLQASHGFVLSSRTEGFPNALLEAMALGLPCIATDCPTGPAELTRGGQDAHLVPLDDDDAMRTALRELMQSGAAARAARGRAAAASVRARYDVQTVLGAWDRLWQAAPARAPSAVSGAPEAVSGVSATGQVRSDSPDAPRLHVLHLISGLGQGGAETVLSRLIAASSRDRVRHTVVSMQDEGVQGASLRASGARVVSLRMRGVGGVMAGLPRLFRLLRTARPDVVQTWMYHADLLGGCVARAAGIRAVAWGVRNSGVDLARGSRSARAMARVCARLSAWLPAVIVVCAQRAAEVHRDWGYRGDRMRVIANGYDASVWCPNAPRRAATRAELGVADDAILLGCIARWNPQKDHANLLAALARCVRAHPDVRCALAGSGMSDDNAALMAQVRHHGLQDHLLLLGSREDAPDVMRALDVHVLASRAEGFPNVVAEAMLAGAACVTTDAGDAAAIVADQGWVVPVANAVALADAIESALAAVQEADWPDRQRQARASIVQRYGLPAMARQYEAVWRELARGRRGRAVAAGTRLRPRLLYFINNPAFFLSHRLPLALGARAAGYEVHVATMGGEAAQIIEREGFEHHVVPLSRSGMRPWSEARSLVAFWCLLRRLQPALVHCVTIKPVLYGGIASRLAGVPGHVAAISGLGYLFMEVRGARRLLRWLTLQLYRVALGHPNSRVIFQNTADRDVLLHARAVRPDQIALLRGSGVDLHRFAPQPWPQGPVVVAMASRLLRDKGVHEFVAAARLSARAGASIRWRLAGSPDPGNPASVTRDDLAQWRAQGDVEWLGECEDVAALYAAAHLVVLPSYREGLPKSLIEAAASGRPVVTTDVPGCRDAIEPGVTGMLIPPRDAQALFDAVRALADDETRRVRMGAAARALAERDFGVAQIVQAHLAIYAALSPVSPVGS